MAIWQFYLNVLPKKGIIHVLGEIPKVLVVCNKEDENEWEYIHEFSAKCWSHVKQPADEIAHLIDKKLNRASWGNDKGFYNWKTCTEFADNDAHLVKNIEMSIEELSFRADLRQNDLKFLQEMLEIAQKYDWLLMDRKKNIVNPTLNEVIEIIKISNPYFFLKDPVAFLTGLVSGEIKPE